MLAKRTHHIYGLHIDPVLCSNVPRLAKMLLNICTCTQYPFYCLKGIMVFTSTRLQQPPCKEFTFQWKLDGGSTPISITQRKCIKCTFSSKQQLPVAMQINMIVSPQKVKTSAATEQSLKRCGPWCQWPMSGQTLRKIFKLSVASAAKSLGLERLTRYHFEFKNALAPNRRRWPSAISNKNPEMCNVHPNVDGGMRRRVSVMNGLYIS